MNSDLFISSIESVLSRRYKDYKLSILKDSLPLNVEFMVVSPEFEGVSRGVRIQHMVEIVEEAFGMRLTFGPRGLGLTQEEADRLGPWDNDGKNSKREFESGMFAKTARHIRLV